MGLVYRKTELESFEGIGGGPIETEQPDGCLVLKVLFSLTQLICVKKPPSERSDGASMP
jgi:hypothetical protein